MPSARRTLLARRLRLWPKTGLLLEIGLGCLDRSLQDALDELEHLGGRALERPPQIRLAMREHPADPIRVRVFPAKELKPGAVTEAEPDGTVPLLAHEEDH